MSVSHEQSDNEYLKLARKKSRSMKRNAMHNIANRMKMIDRCSFQNEGTCLLDGRVYYYCQKRTARIKGEKRYIQMRGFQDFLETFASSPQCGTMQSPEQYELQRLEALAGVQEAKTVNLTCPLCLGSRDVPVPYPDGRCFFDCETCHVAMALKITRKELA